jgi:hypothetical protein
MVKLILLLSMIVCLCSCSYKTIDTVSGTTRECIEEGRWCKYTNKRGDEVCAHAGSDTSFTIPCSFYEGL